MQVGHEKGQREVHPVVCVERISVDRMLHGMSEYTHQGRFETVKKKVGVHPGDHILIIVIIGLGLIAGRFYMHLGDAKNEILALQSEAETAESIMIDTVQEYELAIAERDADLAGTRRLLADMAADTCYFELLGDFDVSYYTQAEPGVDNITATGAEVFEGVVSVDPEVIPLGSEVIIDGQYYLAEDVGGAINGKRIDIFVWEYETAVQGGRQTREVWVKG
jgi:3D (Asp-Asp-Asp) domain-containing protein